MDERHKSKCDSAIPTVSLLLQPVIQFYIYSLYSLPNIVRVVKSRRMRWAGHVARMGEDRGVHMV